jgi:hypothetical protein
LRNAKFTNAFNCAGESNSLRFTAGISTHHGVYGTANYRTAKARAKEIDWEATPFEQYVLQQDGTFTEEGMRMPNVSDPINCAMGFFSGPPP